MEDKAYVVIDDNDQRQRMEQKIDNILRPQGYKIKSFFYNPTDREFWDENQDFDINKFLEKILSDVKTYHVNVIACDYEFSGINQTGVDIIQELRVKGFVCPVILYSGKEQKVASDLFNSNAEDNQKIDQFVKLLKCKIEKFLKRDAYAESIVEILIKNYNLKEIVLKKLNEYPELIIGLDSGFFEGKKIADAIHEIKEESLNGNKFIAELLEFSIAYFAALNTHE